MKILVVSNLYPPGYIGGYELGARDIVQYLRSAGHRVQVLTSNFLNDAEATKRTDYQVSRALNYVVEKPSRILNTTKFRSYWIQKENVLSINSAIHDFSPDLILAFNLRGLGVYAILRTFECAEVPTCLYIMDDYLYGLDLHPLSRKLVDWNFRNMDKNGSLHLIGMTDYLMETFTSHELVSVTPHDTFPGWVNLIEEKDAISKADSVKRRFIFASRISEHKGVYIIIQALAMTPKSFLEEVEFKFIGDGENDKLIEEIEKLELSKYISVSNSMEKNLLLEELSENDFLIFPTWEKEPFGFIVAEAMAYGCIPIITKGIAISEYLETGVDSFLIDRNPIKFRDAILNAISIPDAILVDMKRAARNKAEAYFNSREVLRNIMISLEKIPGDYSLGDIMRDSKVITNSFISVKLLTNWVRLFDSIFSTLWRIRSRIFKS